jgi:MFS transporter, SHS family, lactate transporter
MTDEKYDRYSPEYSEQRDDAGFPATGHTAEKMSAGRYLATRFSTLKPPMDKVANPISLLGTLTLKNWLMFLCAFL